MRNIVLRKLSSLAVLVAVSLGFASCGLLDDESMPYKELEIPATWTKSRMIYREILPGGQKVGCRSKSQAQASPSKLGAVVDL